MGSSTTLDVEGTLSNTIFMGNVGIGTTNPQYTFDFFDNGSAANNAFRVQQGSGSRIMEINNGGMSFNTTGTYGSNSWGSNAMLEVYNTNAVPSRGLLYVKGVSSQQEIILLGPIVLVFQKLDWKQEVMDILAAMLVLARPLHKVPSL